MKKLQNPIRFFFGTEAEDSYVPNRELTAYSVALFGQNASFAMVSQWLNYFMTNVLHISAGKTGSVMGVVRVWDAVNDPIVGTLIDRHKFKNGNKLHPYLGKLAIVIGLVTALMFVDFGLGETAALLVIFFLYIAVKFLFWIDGELCAAYNKIKAFCFILLWRGILCRENVKRSAIWTISNTCSKTGQSGMPKAFCTWSFGCRRSLWCRCSAPMCQRP